SRRPRPPRRGARAGEAVRPLAVDGSPTPGGHMVSTLVRSSTSVDGVVDVAHGPGGLSDVISDAHRLWTMCATLLRAQVSDPVWHTAFEGVRAVGYDGRTLTLGVASTLAKERIEGRYLGLVRDALAEAGAPHVELVLRIEPPEPPALWTVPPPEAPAAAMPAA